MDERIDQLHAHGLIDLHFDLLMDLYEKRDRKNVLATEFLPEFEAGDIGILGVAIYLEDRYLPEMGTRVALDQIASVVERPTLRILVEDPEEVRPPESALDVVWIPIAIDVLVMDAMTRRPPQNRVLRRHRSEDRVEHLHRRRALVALVREEAVISGADRHADACVHADGENRHPQMEAVQERPGNGSCHADIKDDFTAWDRRPRFNYGAERAKIWHDAYERSRKWNIKWQRRIDIMESGRNKMTEFM